MKYLSVKDTSIYLLSNRFKASDKNSVLYNGQIFRINLSSTVGSLLEYESFSIDILPLLIDAHWNICQLRKEPHQESWLLWDLMQCGTSNSPWQWVTLLLTKLRSFLHDNNSTEREKGHQFRTMGICCRKQWYPLLTVDKLMAGKL